jgi:hypothetical protein
MLAMSEVQKTTTDSPSTIPADRSRKLPGSHRATEGGGSRSGRWTHPAAAPRRLSPTTIGNPPHEYEYTFHSLFHRKRAAVQPNPDDSAHARTSSSRRSRLSPLSEPGCLKTRGIFNPAQVRGWQPERVGVRLPPNGGYDAATGARALDEGDADLIAYGVPFLTTPDLVERFRFGAPLNTPDMATSYQGDTGGDIDYPTLAGSVLA